MEFYNDIESYFEDEIDDDEFDEICTDNRHSNKRSAASCNSLHETI